MPRTSCMDTVRTAGPTLFDVRITAAVLRLQLVSPSTGFVRKFCRLKKKKPGKLNIPIHPVSWAFLFLVTAGRNDTVAWKSKPYFRLHRAVEFA